jgi:hypothetical protein
MTKSVPARGLRSAVVVGLFSLIVTGPAFAAAAGATADTVYVSKPVPVDPQIQVAAGSCASASFCMAVGVDGRTAAFTGSSWSPVTTADPATTVLDSVSCPTTSFCATVGDGGDAVLYQDGTWGLPDKIDPGVELKAVSCASASFCVAIAGNDAAVFSDGQWGKATAAESGSPFGLVAVSCVSSSFCMAVDGGGSALTFNGSTWSAPASLGINEVNSVSCSSASFCLAGGAAVQTGPKAMSSSEAAAVQFNGSSWGPPTIMSANVLDFGQISLVSCASPAFCLASDGTQDVTTFNGTAWSAPVSTGNRVTALTCLSATSCVTIGGDAAVSVYNGSSWVASAPASGGEDHVSCPTVASCVAVDGTGRALTLNDGSWGAPVPIDPAGQLTSISCPTSSFCAAADQDGQVLMLNRGAWTPPTLLGPISVSCTGPSFCLGVGSSPPIAYDGTAWHQLPGPQIFAEWVSCSSPRRCAAVGSDAVMTFTGDSWSIPRILSANGQLYAVGCSSRSFCIAAGDSGPSGDYSVYNGKDWSRVMHTDGGSHDFTSISCPAPAFCIAVDDGGRAVVFNGSSASAPATIDVFNSLTSISCAAYWHCVAMDSAGNAVTYDAPRVQIQTGRTRVHHRRATVRLKCDRGQSHGNCEGTVVLVADIHRRVGVRGRRHNVTETVTLARTTYSVAPNRGKLVRLRVTGRASRLLTRARGHRLRTTAIARASLARNATRAVVTRL